MANNTGASGSEAQFRKMTETKIPRLIISLAIPTTISMLVTSIYSMADTYFVSRLGTSASGAVGVVFPLMSIIQAVGFTLGMGSGSIISRLLGKRDTEGAGTIASSALFFGITFGIILAALSFFKIKPLMCLFGSTPTILPYAVSYARFIILAMPIMIGSFILNNVLRSHAKAKFAMVGIASGGILNVALDPLFIFTFRLGTAGAALATAVSQLISFIILLAWCLSKKHSVGLKFSRISKKIGNYLQIFKMGLPSLARQGLSALAVMFLNHNAAAYGDAAVAAMSIVGKIFMIIFAVMLGIGQGFQPVVGFNYGAKKFDRVKKAIYFTLILGTIAMTTISVFTFLFANGLMARFTKNDAEVIRIGSLALKLQCLAMPLVPIGTVCNMAYQMTGKSVPATVLSCARQGIFFLPLIAILPRIWNLFGVQAAQPFADVLTSLFAIPFGLKLLNELRSGEQADTGAN